jgi:hypothetical protein
MPLGIAEFPSSSHALLLPVFLPAENSEVGSTTIYETSSSGLSRSKHYQIPHLGTEAVLAQSTAFEHQ